jgi:hypothetical protein
MCNKTLKTVLILFSIFSIQFVHSQTIGNWNSSSTQTTTPFAVGIGTNTPQAWQEIEYCQNTQTGLIISKNCTCNTGSSGTVVLNSGSFWDSRFNFPIVQVDDENFAQFIPVGFEYLPILSNPSRFYSGSGLIQTQLYAGGQALVWAREKNPNSPGNYGTRFIVTQDGRVGINMPSPRAPLDVRGSYDINVPIAIFGINSNNFTRHLHLVANLGQGAYNGISQSGDYGLFYTDGMGANDGSNLNGSLVIAPWNTKQGVSGIRIDSKGNVGIGTPMINNVNDYKLGVNGLIICKELVVDIEDDIWPDFVFEENYNLLEIDSLKIFIDQNKRLPHLKSASDINNNGEVKLAEMQILLLRKIEELTLYIIEVNEKNKILEQKLNSIKQ